MSNRDTFFSDIKVKSTYLHDIRHDLPDKVFEGESGDTRCYLKSFFSTATSWFTFLLCDVVALNNNCAKKLGIGKKPPLTVRASDARRAGGLVAGDFNGAAWRRTTNANNLSILEDAFADRDLPMPPAPYCCGVLVRCRVRGRTCVGFSSLQTLMNIEVCGNMVHPHPPRNNNNTTHNTRVQTHSFSRCEQFVLVILCSRDCDEPHSQSRT